MRIVIDMQGAQSASKFRGIGRYSLCFARAVAQQNRDHEIILLLSGLLQDEILSIRKEFSQWLPPDQILTWHATGPVCASIASNRERRIRAELVREAFIENLEPDVIHIISIFEGFIDDSVTSVKSFDTRTIVSATFYDLIPLGAPEHYLDGDAAFKTFYFEKLDNLKRCDALFSISEFACEEAISLLEFERGQIKVVGAACDEKFLGRAHTNDNTEELHQLGIDKPFLLYLGATDERKNLPRLIQACAKVPQIASGTWQLVLAGGMPAEHRHELAKECRRNRLGRDVVKFTGHITDQQCFDLYSSCRLFVFPSLSEGFGLPPLEAMQCGAPTIGSNATSLAEVIGAKYAMFDPTDTHEMAELIKRGMADEDFRAKLKINASKQANKFCWNETARRAIRSWEDIFHGESVSKRNTNAIIDDLISRTAETLDGNIESEELCELTTRIAQIKPKKQSKQFLVDITEFAQQDAKTGIQRVVRNYLENWVTNPPPGFDLLPIYAETNSEYRYAQDFMLRSFNFNLGKHRDDLVEYDAGDIFFCPDPSFSIQANNLNTYELMQQIGVTVAFLVHDLLPLELRSFFPTELVQNFERWTRTIFSADILICISNATKVAVEKQLSAWEIDTQSQPKVFCSYIGSDLKFASANDNHRARDDSERRALEFLSVGTIEPRKGHMQVIRAFERLWDEGLSPKLRIVGKYGWLAEETINAIQTSKYLNQNLFWYSEVDDRELVELYKSSDALIAASYGEGFGLPLVEAANYGLPIIARDILVFREIAGGSAFYFKASNASELAETLKIWIGKRLAGEDFLPNAAKMISWATSAKNTADILVFKNRPKVAPQSST